MSGDDIRQVVDRAGQMRDALFQGCRYGHRSALCLDPPSGQSRPDPSPVSLCHTGLTAAMSDRALLAPTPAFG
jgi:hypothetical protein